jgi:WD40 repeat protein/serine/threonine protein kinase
MPTSDREEALFAAALERPTPAERAAYLDGACGDDAALRARVEALLAAHEATGGALDVPPAGLPATTPGRPITEGPGTVIGPYKLLQQIGEGGMGVVYMAEQQQPVRRTVALKIIKPGMDSGQVIARFEAERQALAMMDHQNIARVLDAGTTDSGRPYFVMELVHGVPITRFCDDNRLTPRERLALFVPVCQAIQHAHQKGVIHRDVKPSNVLVTMYDDRPVPKVIDFGVAKAIEQRLTEKTLFTQFGALVGTFEYMSPEQAEMNAFGVDTRSDVYSLGVLLYELLTGTTPLEKQRLRQAALDELVRLIREEEPPRPSQRLSSSNNLPKIAAARKTEPARLSRLMRGEIDWIVMRCLEKDRSRRYDTASGLARDVERYLADEPVEACPPSARYRLSKFARKYRKALATAAAFVALLVAGLVVSTLLAVWATSAEKEANLQRIASDEAKGKALEAKAEADQQRDEARLTAYAAGMSVAQRAWEDNDVVRTRELLEDVPREAGGRSLRGFEWYYLSRLCHSESLSLEGVGSVWLSLGGYCSVMAFSPDGERLASGALGGAVKIWDSATGKELLSLKGHAPGVISVAFSPDGGRLASGGSDKTVKVWDSATGKELLSLGGHAAAVTSVAFSPDGQRVGSMSLGSTPQRRNLLGGSGITVKLWDSATGKELSTAESKADLVTCLAFSPDLRRLASGSADGKVQIWDSSTGKELVALKQYDGSLHSVAFSPDGRRLASVNKYGTAKVWDCGSGKELLSVEAHAGGLMAFSPDGQRLASGSDRAVKVWDSVTGKELFALKGHANTVGSVVFSPDGRRLASAAGQALKIWDCAIGKELFSLKGRAGSEMTCVAFSPDGQRLASGSYRTVNLWDGTTGKELLSVAGHATWVKCVAFSPDGRRLASGGNSENTVKIWDSATGKELLSLKGHTSGVMSVAFSPDGRRLASGSSDKTAKVWDSATGEELLSFEGHAAAVVSVAFSPDGQRLASGSGDGTVWNASVRVWDSATGQELLTLKGHAGEKAAFSRNGHRLVTWGNADNTIKIWDSATGQEVLTLKGHLRHVTSVAFSPDGWRLASGGWDGRVKVWDAATGKELFSFAGQANLVNSVTFSPDGGRLAAVGRGGSISLWETVNVSAETQQRRAANQLVADLFWQLGLRADVLDRLREAPPLSRTQREEALATAQAYAEDPMRLNHMAWEQVRLAGRELPDYRKALRYAEQACLLEPNDGDFLNTLGVVRYRLGDYGKALEALLRSNQIHQNQDPIELAFLAMTQQRLGHDQEAQTYLQRLRERMKQVQSPEAQGFLREAEALLVKPPRPGDK